MNDLDKYFEKARNVEPDISQDDTRKILAGKLSDGGITTNLYHKIRTYPMITTLITSAAIVGILMLSQLAEPINDNSVKQNKKTEITDKGDVLIPTEDDEPKEYDHRKEIEFAKKNPPKPTDELATKKPIVKNTRLDSRDKQWTDDTVDIKSVNSLTLNNDELEALGIIVNRDNFKVNAFNKYAFTIYADNEKEREYFDEERDKDAFPTPAMVTTASGFKTLTLFKNDGIEAIVDRVKSDDGGSQSVRMTSEFKSEVDFDIDENVPLFKVGHMTLDEYGDKLIGHKDSAAIFNKVKDIQHLTFNLENEDVTIKLDEILKKNFSKYKDFGGTQDIKVDMKLIMGDDEETSEEVLESDTQSNDSGKQRKILRLGNNSNLYPGQKIWVEKEKDYRVFIERLDLPDPTNSINRMNYIVGQDTVKIDYFANLSDSETGTTIVMPDGFTKSNDYDEHKKRLNTYLELLGDNPSASMFKEKTNFQVPLTELEITNLQGRKNFVDLLKQSYLSKNNSTNIDEIETMKVQYEFNTYTVDFQKLINDHNGELDFDNDPNLEFLKEDIDPKLANRKNYKTTPVVSWYKKHDNLLIESNIGEMFNYHNRILNESSNEEAVVNRIKTENNNDKVMMKKISTDNQSQNYSFANEEVNIDIEKILSQEYTNEEIEKIMDMDGDVVDVQIMYNDNENREYIIPHGKVSTEEFLKIRSTKLERNSTDKPILKSLKVYVDSAKINSMLNGTPISDLGSKPDMLIGGDNEIKTITTLNINTDKKIGMLIDKPGQKIWTDDDENDSNTTRLYSNMSFSIIKHDINKLIPIEVSLDGNKTDFIVWYEATDEFLEKLPNRLIQKINPELNAADDQAEHCDNEPVKKDDAVMDVWSGCSGAIKGMKLYPNPAVDQSSVELSLEEDRNLSIAIYNLSGKLIKRIGTPTQYSKGQLTKPLDLSGINPGLYYVVVKSEIGEQALQRIIIE